MTFDVIGVVRDPETGSKRSISAPIPDCNDEIDATWGFMERADAAGMEVVAITLIVYPQSPLFN